MRLIEYTPIFVVRSLENSLEFYSRKLNLEIEFRFGDPVAYAGLRKDSVQLHLISAGNTDQPPGCGRLSIITDDVDALHAYCLKEKIEISLEIDDRNYGLRDFNIKDPDGNLIIFGSEL